MLRRPLLALLLAAACTAPPPAAFQPPAITAEVGHFAGPMIRGPQQVAAAAAPGEALDLDPAHALALQGRVLLLQHFPREAVLPLASETRLVLTQPGAEPILAAARLGAGVGRVPPDSAAAFLAGLEAGEWGPASAPIDLAGALPPGFTLALRVASPDPAWTRHIALLAAREPAGAADDGQAPLQVALVFDGLVPEPPASSATRSVRLIGPQAGSPDAPRTAATGDADEDAPSRLVNQKEGVFVQGGLAVGGPPLVLVVPAPLASREAPEAPSDAALVLVLHAQRPSGDPAALAAAVDQCVRNAEQANADRERMAAALTGNEAFLREMLSALAALDIAGRHRSALVFVADATRATLTEDFALLADDATIDAFGKSVHAEAQRLSDMGERGTALGWLLERSAYRMFVEAANDGRLSPAFTGLLLRHAGELGRYPASLEEALASCRDVADFEQRLIAENRQFLEDSSPAARVRAFDWLRTRNAAPDGFDPLGPPAERRAALDRAAESAGARAADGAAADSAAAKSAGAQATPTVTPRVAPPGGAP